MNATAHRVFVIVALVAAICAAVGYPPGVPLLIIAVVLLAIERLL